MKLALSRGSSRALGSPDRLLWTVWLAKLHPTPEGLKGSSRVVRERVLRVAARGREDQYDGIRIVALAHTDAAREGFRRAAGPRCDG